MERGLVTAMAGALALVGTAHAQVVTSDRVTIDQKLASQSIHSAGFGGLASCPCLETLPGVAMGGEDSYLKDPFFGPNGQAVGPLGANYGVDKCQPYDSQQEYLLKNCQNGTGDNLARKNCLKLWCLVDSDNCDVRNVPVPSSMFNNAPEVSVGVSYSTCGDIGQIDQTQALYQLVLDSQENPLRVSFPRNGDTGTGYTINKNEDPGKAELPFTGSVANFAYDLFKKPSDLTDLNIRWEYVETSEDAQETSYTDSSFTQCVVDVAMGRVDLCVGNFWETSQRRGLAEFTSRIYMDEFIIVQFKDPEIKFSDQFRLWFRTTLVPFNSGLWLSLIVIGLFTGLVMWLVEGFSNSGNIPEVDNDFPRNIISGVFTSIFIALYGLVTADLRWDPQYVTTKTFNIFNGFLCLVVLAFYTGQVTTVLFLEEEYNSVNNFEDGINKGWIFCGLEAIKDQITGNPSYSALANVGRYVVAADGPDSLLKMDQGLCNATIISKDEWSLSIRGGPFKYINGEAFSNPDPWYAASKKDYKGYHCKTKEPMKGRVDTAENAFPVAAKFQAPLSWRISTMVQNGAYAAYAENRQLFGLPPDNCTKVVDEKQEEIESQKVKTPDVLGPLIYVYLSGLVAIIVHTLYEARECYKDHQKMKNEHPHVKKGDYKNVLQTEGYKKILHQAPTSVVNFIWFNAQRKKYQDVMSQETEEHKNDPEKPSKKPYSQYYDPAHKKELWYKKKDSAVIAHLRAGADISQLPSRYFRDEKMRNPDNASELQVAHVPALIRIIADYVEERKTPKHGDFYLYNQEHNFGKDETHGLINMAKDMKAANDKKRAGRAVEKAANDKRKAEEKEKKKAEEKEEKDKKKAQREGSKEGKASNTENVDDVELEATNDQTYDDTVSK